MQYVCFLIGETDQMHIVAGELMKFIGFFIKIVAEYRHS